MAFYYSNLLSSEKESKKKMSSTQKSTKCLDASEIKEYIKPTLNDPYYANYPEDYKVVGKLYGIFTCGYEHYMHTQFDTCVKRLDTIQIQLLMI